MQRFFFLSFLFLWAKTAESQVTAKATVDSTHLLIGDQVRMHLEVSQPLGATLLPIDPAVLKADSTIEFLKEGKWDTLQQSATVLRLRKDFLFTAWQAGPHRLPAIPVVYRLAGKTDTFLTRDIPLEVDLPKADTTLADIKPILSEPSNWRDYMPLYMGAGVVLLWLALLLWLRNRRIKKKKQLVPPPIVYAPHELALRNLAELKEKKLWEAGQVKEYHSELTHILREYLEGRFGIQALEQTTDEILAQLRKSDFDASMSGKLSQLLQTADLVKFAKALPSAEFHEDAMRYVEDFILKTRPAERPAETADIKDVR